MHGPTSLEAAAYDQFPESDPIRQLYESDTFMAFLAAALGRPHLYRYDDPLGALNLAVMAVWVSWDATGADAVYANNREATATALRRGAAGEPTLAEVLDAAGSPENPYFEGLVG